MPVWFGEKSPTLVGTCVAQFHYMNYDWQKIEWPFKTSNKLVGNIFNAIINDTLGVIYVHVTPKPFLKYFLHNHNWNSDPN